MSTPLEPLEPAWARRDGELPSAEDEQYADDGTMEQPLPRYGTLQSSPRLLSPARPTRWLPPWTFALPVAGLLVAVAALTLGGQPQPAPVTEAAGELQQLGAWLSAHPEGDLDLRTRYADALTEARRYEEAFEEYLTVVRRSPTGPHGSSALGSAVVVAETLALAEGTNDLWTERWVATVDRYARYWPGDPLTPVLVEETVHTLVARNHLDEARVLTTEHLHR